MSQPLAPQPLCFQAQHMQQDPVFCSRHLRYIDNHFMGTSHKAYEANVLLMHVTALCILLRRSNPLMLLGLENPIAKFKDHPIVKLMEAAEHAGGFGRVRVSRVWGASMELCLNRVPDPSLFAAISSSWHIYHPTHHCLCHAHRWNWTSADSTSTAPTSRPTSGSSPRCAITVASVCGRICFWPLSPLLLLCLPSAPLVCSQCTRVRAIFALPVPIHPIPLPAFLKRCPLPTSPRATAILPSCVPELLSPPLCIYIHGVQWYNSFFEGTCGRQGGQRPYKCLNSKDHKHPTEVRSNS